MTPFLMADLKEKMCEIVVVALNVMMFYPQDVAVAYEKHLSCLVQQAVLLVHEFQTLQ